jgi:hypothetical protein
VPRGALIVLVLLPAALAVVGLAVPGTVGAERSIETAGAPASARVHLADLKTRPRWSARTAAAAPRPQEDVG